MVVCFLSTICAHSLYSMCMKHHFQGTKTVKYMRCMCMAMCVCALHWLAFNKIIYFMRSYCFPNLILCQRTCTHYLNLSTLLPSFGQCKRKWHSLEYTHKCCLTIAHVNRCASLFYNKLNGMVTLTLKALDGFVVRLFLRSFVSIVMKYD